MMPTLVTVSHPPVYAQHRRLIRIRLVAEDQSKLAQGAQTAICRPLAVVVGGGAPKEAASHKLGGDDAVARHPTDDFDVALG
jgi:hypothetical protein